MMDESLVSQVTRYLKSQRRRKIGYQILTCMASVVVFCTVYALILPAITISNELTCGLEQHEHDESCYAMAAAVPQPELVCDTSDLPGILLHTHNKYCYDNDGNLICTLTEREAHTHSDACYQEHKTLICEEVQELGHTHTSACYARDRGKLICTIPEGEGQHTHTQDCLQVTEKQVLSCGKTEEPAHTHDDSCYTTRTKKVLVCTESEEPAHTHDSSCYTTEETERLTCGESEREDVTNGDGSVTPGHTHGPGCYSTETKEVLTCTQSTAPSHRHTDACYETEEETVLTCTQRESEGHTHDESCYRTETETTVLCGQEESAGHVHDDKCYEWTERLTCTQEERPAGHIHDESCYETERVLSCHQMELEEHVHGESCYGEDGALTCQRREVSRHQHTAACVHIPESTGEEVLTLICGKEEHIHKDTCYVDVVPSEDQEFFCGIPEHTHTKEKCYFQDSDQLFCTIPEHVHTDECRQPPVVEKPKYTGAEGVELDNDFTYENDAFLVTFHVSGYAPLLYDNEPITMEDNGLYSGIPDALPGDGGSSEPPASQQEDGPASAPETKTEAPSEPDTTSEPETGSAPAQTPDPDTGGAESTPPTGSGDFGGFGGDEGYSVPETPTEGTVLLDPADVEFTVEPLSEGSREYQQMASHAEEYNDNEEPPMLEVLSFSAAIDGQELDLSDCTVEVEVTISELLLEYLNSYNEAQAMAIPEGGMYDEPSFDEPSFDEPGVFDGSVDGGGSAEITEAAVFTLVTYSMDSSGEFNDIATTSTADSDTVSGQMGQNDENKVVIALLPRIYPNYTIEFYAKLDRPAIGAEPEGASVKLPFIDTSKAGNNSPGPVMPQNGNLNAKETGMWIDANGNVLFNEELTEIYKAKEKLIFNPLVETTDQQLTVKRLNALRENPHYKVTELKVLQPGKDPEKDEDWEVYPEARLDALRFTNNPKAAAANENIVLIQQEGEKHTVLRLIYEPTSHTKDYGAVFYDYDVTNGLQSDGKVNVSQKGINSSKNYANNGNPKLAFGNSQSTLNTGLGDQPWSSGSSNNINGANTNGYNGCTFGLAAGVGAGDTLIFNSGIDAPALFGDEDAAGKKTIKGHSLRFNQEGDTYTLSAVTGTSATGLERFGYNRWNYSKTRKLYSNNFWPMDGVTEGVKDPQFGKKSQYATTSGGHLPEDDYGGVHNAYFGMNFAVEFNLEKEYVGPLEYHFYGDDDMWVFLDNEHLICDIGGVHGSVGEYVDLWDYIPGGRENHEAGPHTLYFYYTERGASGSTCWMQFTLPNVVHIPVLTPPDENAKPLRIEKVVTGASAPDPEFEYTFTIQLTGNLDQSLINNFGGAVYDPRSENPEEPIAEVNDINCDTPQEFKLKAGQYFEIYGGLPAYAGYIVKELRPDLSETVLATWRPSVDTILDGGTPSTEAGADAAGTIGNHQVVLRYTNAFTYELPETGGGGPVLYTLTGALLPAVTGGLWYRKRKSKREGAVD